MGMTLAYIMAPVYVMLGLSVLLYAKAWQKVGEKWMKDHLSLVPLMFTMAVLGMVVVYLHNVWEWSVWLLVTLTGWGMLVKAVFYFILPGSVIQAAYKLWKNTTLLYLGGLVTLVVGVVLGYYAYFV